MKLNNNIKSLAIARGFWYTIVRKKERRNKNKKSLKIKKFKNKKVFLDNEFKL